MAGDVNLFLNDPDDDRSVAEIEVMIAEAGSRRTGLGKEAVRLMMAYGRCVFSGGGKRGCMRRQEWRGSVHMLSQSFYPPQSGATVLGIRRFYCKINEANTASIAMFRGCGGHLHTPLRTLTMAA